MEHYFFPDDLETQIDAFVANYNRLRSHESINNLIPADAYSDAGGSSCWNEKGSNAKPSQIDACFTEHKLPNITNQMRQMPS